MLTVREKTLGGQGEILFSRPVLCDRVAVRLEHVVERLLHTVVHIAAVVQERDSTARAQNAVDLGQRAVGIEPVEGLRADDGVDRRVRERDVLGGPLQRLDLRRDPLQVLAHLVERLDRDHCCTARYEVARELPRAGGEIEHSAARADAQPLAHPRDRLGRVARPAALVHVRSARESPSGDLVDAQEGVTRYASKTASMLRSAVSSPRRSLMSPTSAVYQFFAS